MPENDKGKDSSALHVNKGVDQPGFMNQDAIKKFKSKGKRKVSIDKYVEGILQGDKTILGKAITLVESSLSKHQVVAQQIIEKCLPHSGNSVRVGITGVPGVGKSTFIEALGTLLTKQGKKVAVSAIDPSSHRSKGSILGDKTRMSSLASNDNAFIRPSPSAGTLGGVARKTREIIILCEAAGYEVILIETVGVGQSEIAVHSMVDFFLLLMLAGAGDELQGIKRGIMEMADGIAINKADGKNIIRADATKVEFQNALNIFPPTGTGWKPKVVTASSLKPDGTQDAWKLVEDYINLVRNNGVFQNKRKAQLKNQMYDTINDTLRNHFYNNISVQQNAQEIEKQVLDRSLSPFQAARKLMENYYHSVKNSGDMPQIY